VEVTATRDGLRAASDAARARGAIVGLVPTMGALHEGHRSLLRRARGECGFVAMTLFVNPLQFGPDEDLAAYPRTRDHDLAAAEEQGCDLVFAPDESEMFAPGPPEVTVDPGPLGARLEGASRPGHFEGVLTVVAKLFGLAGPSRAYFGEKDAQQLELVRRMSGDLDQPIQVVGCPTVRGPDGLALSSRNGRLTPDQRGAATSLVRALSIGARLVGQGEGNADAVRAEMARRIGAEPLAALDYVAAVDDRTWQDVGRIEGPVRLLVAAAFGGTRLIDNLVAKPPGRHAPDGSGDRAQ
jgi:pantoate--beta-alanine ligase